MHPMHPRLCYVNDRYALNHTGELPSTSLHCGVHNSVSVKAVLLHCVLSQLGHRFKTLIIALAFKQLSAKQSFCNSVNWNKTIQNLPEKNPIYRNGLQMENRSGEAASVRCICKSCLITTGCLGNLLLTSKYVRSRIDISICELYELRHVLLRLLRKWATTKRNC